MRFLLSLSIIGACFGAPAIGQTWEFEYLEADEPGQISTCNAVIRYADGPFLVRIYSDVMDLIFADDSLSLPADQMLGSVQLVFKNDDFSLAAYSGGDEGGANVDYLFLHPAQEDYQSILQLLRYSSDFQVMFPDESSFRIDLQGSAAALGRAIQCWQDLETGPYGNNPFEDSSSGTNPFD